MADNSLPQSMMPQADMVDLSKQQSLGAALREALDKFSGETCLIEADRERENHRWTYRQAC